MAQQSDPHTKQTDPTPFKGLLIFSVVVVAITAFVGMTTALELKNSWAGFLFLLYWGGVDKAQVTRLPADTIGALAGLMMGYLLWLLPAQLGGAGIAIFLVVIALSTYFLIMGWLPMIINLMTMLFLSVTAIPQIQHSFDIVDLFLSLVLGVAFFGALVWLGSVLARRKLGSVPVSR